MANKIEFMKAYQNNILNSLSCNRKDIVIEVLTSNIDSRVSLDLPTLHQ